MKYAIACKGEYFEKCPAYWTCAFVETQNYSMYIEDATLFANRSSAYAMIKTLGADDHVVVEVPDGIHDAARSD